MMKRTLSLFMAALMATAVILLIHSPQIKYLAGFALLWLLPGLIWMSVLSPDSFDKLERIVVGLGLSYVVTLPVVLVAAYLPGALTPELLLIVMLAAMGLPVLLQFIQQKRGIVSSPAADLAETGVLVAAGVVLAVDCGVGGNGRSFHQPWLR